MVDFSTKLVIYVALAGVIWKSFSICDRLLHPSVLVNLIKQIRRVRPSQSTKNWSKTFVILFDRFFSTHHFSWRCLWRSSLVSIVAVVLMSVLYLTTSFRMEFELKESDLLSMENVIGPAATGIARKGMETINKLNDEEKQNFITKIRVLVGSGIFLFAFVGATIVNFLPDFFSLLQTRYILKFMSKAKRTSVIFGWLLLDALLTSLIVVIALFIFTYLYTAMWAWYLAYATPSQFGQETWESLLKFKGLPPDSSAVQFFWQIWPAWAWRDSMENILDGFRTPFGFGPSIMGVFVYSTFLTSIWLWLYGFSFFIVRASYRVERLRTILVSYFHFDKNPLSVMGGTLVVLMTPIYWLLVTFYY